MWLGEEPERPTIAELEAHDKVERYWRWVSHRFAINRREFEVRYEYDMPPMIVTEHGESPMTDDDWRTAGFEPVEDEHGETVGWRST